MDNFLVSGINELDDYLPYEVDVTEAISTIERVEKSKWVININEVNAMIKSISRQSLINALDRMDLQPEDDGDNIFITCEDKNPKKYIESLIASARERENEQKSEKLKKHEIYQRTDPILNSVFVYHGICNGTNIIDVLMRDDVNREMTYTNDVYENKNVYGLMAVRNFQAMYLSKLAVDANQDLSFKLAQAAVNFMTQRGQLIPMTVSGLSKTGASTFAQSSFQRALPPIISASMAGVEQPTNDVISSTYFGRLVPAGTGIVTVEVNPEKRKEIIEAQGKVALSAMSRKIVLKQEVKRMKTLEEDVELSDEEDDLPVTDQRQQPPQVQVAADPDEPEFIPVSVSGSLLDVFEKVNAEILEQNVINFVLPREIVQIVARSRGVSVEYVAVDEIKLKPEEKKLIQSVLTRFQRTTIKYEGTVAMPTNYDIFKTYRLL